LVFFMPSLEGDMPLFARLRAAFAGQVRFEVPHYPSASELMRCGGRFEAIVDAVVAQVRMQAKGAPYRFLGVSSGAFVAWEVARRLVEAGEPVRFIGLLDARRSAEPLPPRISLAAFGRGLVIRPRSTLGDLARKLAAKSAFNRLRMLHFAVSVLSRKQATRFRMRLGILLRRKALDDATIGRLNLPATLFRTEDQWSGPHDYGWGALCRQLSIVNIEGTHLAMFAPQHLDSLRDRIVEALEAAGTLAAPSPGRREQARRAG
jgi:thioesterase domain-containing protein